MTAFLIHPSLTIGNNTEANSFYDTLKNELAYHVAITPIVSETVLRSSLPSMDDIVVCFNGTSNSYSQALVSFLDNANLGRSDIIGVAISKAHRTPIPIVAEFQNFDVVEMLRQRKLRRSQLETVAVELARTIITRVQPTLSSNNLSLFLSYRRVDGEEIAGAIYDELQIRLKQGFRDLSDIQVGADAQEVIMGRLRKSNTVMFLDTPKSGESTWIAKELQTALALNIPIIWIRIGSETDRAELQVTPSGQPHLQFEQLKVSEYKIDPKIVDEMLDIAFDVSRQFAKHVFVDIERIMKMQKQGSIVVSRLDRKFLTYEIQIPRRYRFRYVERPITHVVQFYGRIPSLEDKQQFVSQTASWGYKPHPIHGYDYYDAAVMLSPIPAQTPNTVASINQAIVDSSDAYITSLESYIRTGGEGMNVNKNGLIISGAFPDCEPEHQQYITDAVHAFTQAVMDRGGTIIFGAHPTFQHLIFDMARQRRVDFKSAVHMYISKHFATNSMIDDYRQSATITATEDVDGERAKSLTVMRQAMIRNEEAAGMIVIGGKTARPHIDRPGIDEEIQIAKSIRLPVFLIGSTGGRTAELVDGLGDGYWPNTMPDSFNHELSVSMNYNLLAKNILDHLEI